MKYLLKYLLLLSLLVFTACTTYEISPSGRTIKTESEYFNVIEQHSDSTEKYSGLYNLLNIEATLLNSKVLDAQTDQLTRLYLWDDKKAAEERVKVAERTNKETEVFMAFFTPDRKNDDAAKPKTVWRVFLDVDGRRIEGKVTKIKLQLSQLIALYPYHNRFYSPYQVIFPVPVKSIENHEIQMTVTGAVGSATLKFKP
jgi:endo-beta-N-acetylglucosaminidase D